MTRKDFELIAEILRGSGTSTLVDEFALVFSRTYPRFDAQRFTEACGQEYYR